MDFDKILILDFGNKHTQSILRKIRELGVFSLVYNYDFSAKEIRTLDNIKGIILSGNQSILKCDQKIFDLNIPILEISKEVNDLTILKNFILTVCNARINWNLETIYSSTIKKIKAEVKEDRVLLAISGGVDSTVAAVLLSQAIGKQLTCLFIDNGLLRLDEENQVMQDFQDFGIDIRKIDAREIFLNRLKGIVAPEEKRKVIGKTFIEVFDEESKKLGDFKFLAQGTIYTDIIESGGKTSKTIKSHHNVGGLPSNMRFSLLEPLKYLLKDEVRKLGLFMNITEDLIQRQPFPGPGLAIRIIGDLTLEKLRIVRETDHILREEFKANNLDKKVWQYFTVLTGIKTVGVVNNQRTYTNTIAIRAVNSIDGMSSSWSKIPYDVLERISRRMVDEVVGCGRVVLDITSKPPATIEWE